MAFEQPPILVVLDMIEGCSLLPQLPPAIATIVKMPVYAWRGSDFEGETPPSTPVIGRRDVRSETSRLY